VNPWLFYLSVLVAFWIYFFVYAERVGIKPPWGFGIVFVGLYLVGETIDFHENQIVFFSINLTLVVCLIGLVLNINNIKEQFRMRDHNTIFPFIVIGLIFGLLIGFAMQIPQRLDSTLPGSQYTKYALLAATIQISLAEEFLFTGYFLGYLKKYGVNQIFAIAFLGLFFALLHSPRYSGDWVRSLIVFLSAAVSASVAWKSNSLIPSFVLHLAANLIAFMFYIVRLV
jgi:membrane protease YdiL (CAAX protease family)